VVSEDEAGRTPGSRHKRGEESRPGNTISPPRTRQESLAAPPNAARYCESAGCLCQAGNQPLCPGQSSPASGVQRKREPLGMRPQKLSLLGAGSFPPMINITPTRMDSSKFWFLCSNRAVHRRLSPGDAVKARQGSSQPRTDPQQPRIGPQARPRSDDCEDTVRVGLVSNLKGRGEPARTNHLPTPSTSRSLRTSNAERHSWSVRCLQQDGEYPSCSG
jgi:hypothetical protein